MAIPPYDLVAATRHVSKKDRALARVIREVGPCALEISSRQSPYQALVESIVYQQLSGRAAATIYGRLCRSFGSSRCPKPQQVLESSDEQLRGAGLSRSKAAALRDLATHALADRIPTRTQALRLPDDELIARLTEVRGVGRWTAEMFLIFNLGRPDVLPVDDYGVRKGFARTQGREVLPRPKELTDHGERWRPFRSVASWYLWRACELA